MSGKNPNTAQVKIKNNSGPKGGLANIPKMLVNTEVCPDDALGEELATLMKIFYSLIPQNKTIKMRVIAYPPSS